MNYVRQIELDLKDQIGYIGVENSKHNIFSVDSGTPRLYDFDDNVHLAITYELDRDLTVIRRQVFGILDFLGAIGGLAGALHGLFGILIIVFQYKAAIAYVGNHTYQIKEGEDQYYKNVGSDEIP